MESAVIMPEIVDNLKAVEKVRASNVKQTHGPTMAVKGARAVIKEAMEKVAKALVKDLADRLEDAFYVEGLASDQSARN